MIDFGELEMLVTLLQVEIGHMHRNPHKYGIQQEILLKDNNASDYTDAVDITIEKVAKARLMEILPGSGFIGEETDAQDAKARYVWVVDPTDGTAVFARGGEYYSNSIALIDREEGKVPFGAVYQSRTQRQFVRVEGKLAVREKRRNAIGGFCHAEYTPTPSASQGFGEWLGCSFGTSRHYKDHPGIKEKVESLFEKETDPLLKRDFGLINARPYTGSSALFACDIAAGNRHFAVLFFQKAWDLAVGVPYAMDAGCPTHILDNDGRPTGQDPKQVIAGCDKDTLINVTVSANQYIDAYVMKKLGN